MRAVLQRVKSASVVIDGAVSASIGEGILVLLGIAPGDGADTIDYMLDKIINMRIFEDNQGKMNLSLSDVSRELLTVPNFTLYGDTRKGRRPSYSNGAKPKDAELIFGEFKRRARSLYDNKKLGFGTFQAEMLVNIQNDGPVTLLLDSGD